MSGDRGLSPVSCSYLGTFYSFPVFYCLFITWKLHTCAEIIQICKRFRIAIIRYGTDHTAIRISRVLT